MSKVKNLPELGSLDDNDLVYAVDSTAGVNSGRKITKQNLKESLKPSDSETKTAYENNANTNAYSDAEKSKLAGIESGATADQDGNEVNYDNNISGLSATNVKEAIDEVVAGKEDAFVKKTAFNKDFGSVAGTVVQGNDARLSTTQRLTVKLNPGPGQFSSIKAAVDSIGDASQNKPYQVNIGPGVYSEDTISLPPFVHVRGEREATIVKPTNPNNDIFVLSSNCSVAQVRVEGAIGSNAAAFRRTGGSTECEINLIEFGDNTNLVVVESTAGAPTVLVNSCRIETGVEFVDGFRLSGTGNGTLIVNNLTGFISGTGINPTSIFDATGSTNKLIIIGSNIRTEPPASTASGLRLTDGIQCYVSGLQLIGPTVGLDVPNIGAGPILDISGLTVTDEITYSSSIENPNTTGFVNGAWDFAKTNIDQTASENLSLAFNETGSPDFGLIAFGDIIQGTSKATLLNISKLNREEASLGLLTGGEITKTANPFEIAVASGVGFLKDSNNESKEVSWAGATTVLPANSVRFITLNDTQTLQVEASLPADLSERVIMGRVVTNDVGVSGIDSSSANMKHQGNLVERYLRNTFGALYASGSIVNENSGTDRAIDVSAGEYYFGTSRFVPSGGMERAFTLAYRDGAGDFTEMNGQTIVPNDVYDDGSGTPVAIPSGNYVKGALLGGGDGINERYTFIMGQSTFVDLNDAVASDLPNLPQEFGNSFTTIAAIIVQEGAPNIVDIIDIRPTPSFSGAASGSSSDHGGLTGLVDDDHPQYLLANGTRALSGNLNMGGSAITNTSTVNGVNVQNHGSRHNPGGADPLATAAPLTNLSGNTANSVGTANSYSRSDHSHAINLATGSVSGLMSTTDKSKLDNIEANAKDDQSAAEVPYNNSSSGLSATQVQTAIDEVEDRLETNEENTNNHVNGGANKHDASEVDYERADGSKKDIQASSDTVETALTDLDDNKLSRSGAQPMTGNLNMDSNNITNVGTVNGVTVESHASRHNPGGADPLATAAPSANLSASTPNAEGAASSLSRSDHSHAISTGSPVASLSATTTNIAGSAASIARSDHGHAILTGLPSTQLPAQANAAGTSPNLARADHTHNIPVGSAVELTDSTNGAGSASSFARSDHSHSHGNRGGGTLHALVTTVVNGFMSAADKIKLNRLGRGHLSYSNVGAINTSSSSFSSMNIGVNRESFPNSFFTKVNNTDFRADFSGQVRVTFKVNAEADVNNEGFSVGIQRNATDISWTETRGATRNDLFESGSASASFILDCSDTDIFRLRLRTQSGNTITVPTNEAYMTVEVYRIA